MPPAGFGQQCQQAIGRSPSLQCSEIQLQLMYKVRAVLSGIKSYKGMTSCAGTRYQCPITMPIKGHE